MTERRPAAPRVLLAVDSVIVCERALALGVSLAAQRGGELLGLFVEDVHLLRFAGLPFAREIVFGSVCPLDPGRLQQRFRLLAGDIERRIGQAAARASLVWSFRIVRGEMVSSLLALAGETDLLIVAQATAMPLESLRPAMQAATALPAPVLVLFDAAPSAARALNAAAQLAQTQGRPLSILLPRRDASLGPALRREALSVAQQAGVQAQLRVLPEPGVAGLIRQARVEGAAGIVVGLADAAGVADLRHLSAEAGCPIVIVR